MNLEQTSSKTRTPKLLIVICALLWIVGFTYNTGFGEMYNIFTTTKDIVIGIFIVFLFIHIASFSISFGNLFTMLLVVLIAYLNEKRYGYSIYDYIWVWSLIPLLNLFKLEKKQFNWIGFIYGIASIAVLLIGNLTSIFKNWDGNSVSMVQFFSYTVFMSVFVDIKDEKNIRNIIIFSVAYFILLKRFESRSAILFSVVLLLCILSVIPLRRLLSKAFIFIILISPLIIALFVTSINETTLAENLNNWSLEIFNKSIFNGRDIIWESGIETWYKTPFIGNGNLSNGNYHNSAITTLVAVGGVGYFLLIGSVYKILTAGLKWLNDSIIYGLTASFLIIWMQQSVELGLIASKPNVIPYVILGLLYARVSTLEGRTDDTDIDNNSDLQHGKISS